MSRVAVRKAVTLALIRCRSFQALAAQRLEPARTVRLMALSLCLGMNRFNAPSTSAALGATPTGGPSSAPMMVPEWPVPATVRAVFTTRVGGTSRGPWQSFNLGNHVGDDPGQVGANRRLLETALGARPVFLQQVHGTGSVLLSQRALLEQQADACVTAERQLACTVLVADCLPVLLASADGRVVAAAHAGWRGLAGTCTAPGQQPFGVLESVFESFNALARTLPKESAIKKVASSPCAVAGTASANSSVVAWLGPCIGPAVFEVGAEVKTAFELAQPSAGACFRPLKSDKYLCDLAALARQRLRALGVTSIHGNDSSAGWCTFSNPERYFSYRRDASAGSVSATGSKTGATGRMAACVWLA